MSGNNPGMIEDAFIFGIQEVRRAEAAVADRIRAGHAGEAWRGLQQCRLRTIPLEVGESLGYQLRRIVLDEELGNVGIADAD